MKAENLTLLLGAAGLLVFGVQLCTEVLKRLPGLRRIPTDLLVFALSVLLCIGTLCGYNSYAQRISLWYEYALAAAGGFVVAYIAMFGWGKLRDLWARSKKT